MTIEKLVNVLIDKYYQDGYLVKEICLPVEWKNELTASLLTSQLKNESVNKDTNKVKQLDI